MGRAGSGLVRFENWPVLLAQEIDRARAATFAWGVHDCCLWAADVVKALTGVDHAADLRGTYSDEAGARARIEALGGLEAFVGSRLGAPIALGHVWRGDVVLHRVDGVEYLGICDGRWTFFVAPRGLLPVRTQGCVLAWRVD